MIHRDAFQAARTPAITVGNKGHSLTSKKCRIEANKHDRFFSSLSLQISSHIITLYKGKASKQDTTCEIFWKEPCIIYVLVCIILYCKKIPEYSIQLQQFETRQYRCTIFWTVNFKAQRSAELCYHDIPTMPSKQAKNIEEGVLHKNQHTEEFDCDSISVHVSCMPRAKKDRTKQTDHA